MTDAASTPVPLLAAAAARIAVDDAIAVDRLDLEVAGPRLLVLGDATALIAALTGVSRPRAEPPAVASAPESRVVAGRLLLLGRDVAAHEHVDITGAAPLDVPLPPDWTALELLLAAMRLGGVRGGRDATARARRALEETGLGHATSRAIRSLAVPERRALHFAAALARDVQVVIADEPLAGLEGAAAAFVLGAIGAATRGRAAILSARPPSPGAPEGVLAENATHLAVLAGGELAFLGTPASLPRGARLWGLTVRANAEALAVELQRRGVALRGGPLRFSAALPEGVGSRELVEAAVIARAPVVEMRPLW